MIYEFIGIKKEYDKDFSITVFLCAVDSVTTFFLTHSVYDDYDQDAFNQYDNDDEIEALPQPMGLFGHKSANNQGYYLQVNISKL